MPTPQSHEDFKMLSEAVHAWFSFYDVEPDEQASHKLSAAALEFFNEGYCTLEDLSTVLIGTYIGRWSTRVNAPTSSSIH